jgi:hypothetical protein
VPGRKAGHASPVVSQSGTVHTLPHRIICAVGAFAVTGLCAATAELGSQVSRCWLPSINSSQDCSKPPHSSLNHSLCSPPWPCCSTPCSSYSLNSAILSHTAHTHTLTSLSGCRNAPPHCQVAASSALQRRATRRQATGDKHRQVAGAKSSPAIPYRQVARAVSTYHLHQACAVVRLRASSSPSVAPREKKRQLTAKVLAYTYA